MSVEALKKRVQKFVWSLMVAPDEHCPMSVPDAATNMQEWKKEGLYWPRGMTPEMLAEVWNTEII